MASYLRQVFSTAFARWAPRTDLWGGVFGALVPCAYALTGQPVPDNVATLIAEIAVGTAGGLIALRLLFAPYIIWKADQATIAELKDKLNDPQRRRKEYFENRLLDTKAELASELVRMLEAVRGEAQLHRNTSLSLDEIYPKTAMFLSNFDFKIVWTSLSFHHHHLQELIRQKVDIAEAEYYPLVDWHNSQFRLAARFLIAHLTGDEIDERKYHGAALEAEKEIPDPRKKDTSGNII